MWLLALITQTGGSSIGLLNHASRHYFWSDPAIPPPPALSFWSRLLTSTLLQHTAIFQVMNYVLTWLCIAVNDLLSNTKTNIYLSRSKRVASCTLKLCDSFIISHVAVLSRIPSSKWGLSRCHHCIFIPHPAIELSVIPHPTSILILIPHPVKPVADPHKSLLFHFVLNCYHPLYFRANKKLLTSSTKW